MEEASEALEFERAIEYRELVNSVQKIAQKQKITDTAGDDRDIVAVSKDLEDAVVQVLFYSKWEIDRAGSFLSEASG